MHAVVAGRVQGVFFRAYVSRRATEIGLKGWVRTLPDGNVEVQAEGERAALEKLIGFLHTGPPSAVVTAVETVWADCTGRFAEFGIGY
jgi:acylphosphatase